MFCKNCGAHLPEGSAFCSGCGERVEGNGAAGSPPAPQAATHQPNTAKTVAIVLAVLVVFGGACGGLFLLQSQRAQEQALQASREELTAAQQAAEQAQKDAETARAEQQKAQSDAEKAAQEASSAKSAAEKAAQEASRAKSDAAAQATIILAAIVAAQDGGDISFDGYIFPSDRTYISKSDMAYWDQTIALLARNEIYARHGYVFETDYIQNYFSAQSWYWPDESYKGGNLSKVEQSNVDTILAYEKQNGWM